MRQRVEGEAAEFFRRVVAPVAGGVGMGGFVQGDGQQGGGDHQKEGGGVEIHGMRTFLVWEAV